MSLALTLTRHAIRLVPMPLRSERALRRTTTGRRAAAPVPRRVRRDCDVTSSTIGGFEVITLRPRDLPPGSPHLVYFPGGAYVAPLLGPHWTIIHELMRRSPASATVPLYPLAPQHTVDDAFTFLDTVTAHIGQEHTGRLVYAGDSAGGGLALAYAIRQRDLGITPAPSGLVLFSPWVDVTMTNPHIRDLEPLDTMLRPAQLRTCGRWWAGPRPTTDPAVSPLLADLAGLPPVTLFQGDHDLFLPDVTELHHRIQQAGGTSNLTITPGGFHAYVGATWTPETRHILSRAAATIHGQHPTQR